MDTVVEVLDSLAQIASAEWDALSDGNPFVSHAFLHALHISGCASDKTGWSPCYLVIRREGVLAGAMLLYAKSHSRGEYVFDHAWAQAYERHGLDYYPKLLSAVPFSAVSGPRLLAANEADKAILLQAAVQFAEQSGVSSLHILFPRPADLAVLRNAGLMLREGVQFHWLNKGYASFDDFLASMTREKRKKVKQDGRRVADAGVSFRRLRGSELGEDELDFFYHCYALTYQQHYSTPYLSRAFFRRIQASMGENLLLIIAEREGKPLAAALNVMGAGLMYGRYWGTTAFVSGLHFELCYMQAIAYCIETGIGVFEGGAQGEHKLSRGLEPTPTWSAHWVADRRFEHAIQEFLEHETVQMDEYIDELAQRAPFKRPAD